MESKERIEAMSELLTDLNISATEKQIEELTEAFCTHLEIEREINSYQYISSNSGKSCDKCKDLKDQIKRLNEIITIHENSVKSRRKADEVWVEGDSVMYR